MAGMSAPMRSRLRTAILPCPSRWNDALSGHALRFGTQSLSGYRSRSPGGISDIRAYSFPDPDGFAKTEAQGRPCAVEANR